MKLYTLSEKIKFHTGFRGTYYLDDGWDLPEKYHCWTNGFVASINFMLRSSNNNDLLLKVFCSAFIPKSKSYLDVGVFINDEQIDTWRISERRWYSAKVKRSLFLNNSIRLTFRISSPSSPREHGLSDDSRLLGIDIGELVFLEDFKGPTDSSKKIGSNDLLFDCYNSLEGFHKVLKKDSLNLFRKNKLMNIYEDLKSQGYLTDYFFSSENECFVISPITGCYIFPPHYPLLMFQDAALTWLDINKYLCKKYPLENYGLIDGHYGNFVQVNNARPVWCDYGSIINSTEMIFTGFCEFINCYVVPLIALGQKGVDSGIIRNMMYENQPVSVYIEMLKNTGFNSESIFDVLPIIQENFKNNDRVYALNCVEELIKKLDFSHHNGFWSNYRDFSSLEYAWNGQILNNPDSRFKTIFSLVNRSNPETFIDIGSNDGVFSLLSARNGLKGIAIDLDEHAINKLYTYVREHPSIEISVCRGGFLDVNQTADLVLALALTHHLSLSQNLSFSEIAAQLSVLSRRAVITEFMTYGLGGTSDIAGPFPDPLPDWYTLDHFIDELKKKFAIVDIITYVRDKSLPWYSERVLIYCEK